MTRRHPESTRTYTVFPDPSLCRSDRTATRPVTVAALARDAARARAGAGHGGRRRPRRPGIARAARPRRADSPGAARRARRPSLWRAALAARARSDFGGHATRPEARSILYVTGQALDHYGAVEAGKAAEPVLLDRNPPKDIAATAATRSGVQRRQNSWKGPTKDDKIGRAPD